MVKLARRSRLRRAATLILQRKKVERVRRHQLAVRRRRVQRQEVKMQELLEVDAPAATAADAVAPLERGRRFESRMVSVLGVRITDVSKPNAMCMMEDLIKHGDGACQSVFLVNAHTLNVATENSEYRDVLNSADYVFNDGTGVRWASRQRGVELRDNLCGTDLIPDFFQATAGRGYSYFLLGADARTIEEAAAVAEQRFPGWKQAGFRHGFSDNGSWDDIVQQINSLRPDMLLVGMGNPLQERWINRFQSRLHVPLAVGVGGLFDHWVDRPRRAPLWVRRAGCEWMHKLMLQPHKWRRYVLGNPLFLYRVTRAKGQDRAAMQAATDQEVLLRNACCRAS